MSTTVLSPRVNGLVRDVAASPKHNLSIAATGASREMDAGRTSELARQLRGLGQDQQGMLDAIDRLRSTKLSDIELPQLVVVGDQSAGKSSVLDAISGIPVPRHAGACTKIATEFRLRRAQGGEHISVSVTPGPDRTDSERHELSKLSENLTNVTVEKLGDVIRNIGNEILSMHAQRGQGKFTSRDVLTIEIAGPKMPMLTLVDLPGFIHTPGEQQTEDDIDMIHEIAESYMRKPRTIILAVISGGSNYANQVVMRKAEKHDPQLKRTLGIITKPDLAKTTGHEGEFLKLAGNKYKMLDLGWHVLRNRGPQEAGDSKDRDKIEREFFAQAPWNELDKADTGVEDLRSKLSVLLYGHIADHMPQLLGELGDELQRTKKELRALGPRIGDGVQMRMELGGLFDQSSRLIECSTSGGSGPNLRSDPQDCSRLTETEKREMARGFYSRITGERRDFEEEIRLHGREQWFDDRGAVATAYLKSEVQPLLDRSSGRQLPGDLDPMLPYDLFEKLSSEWDAIAKRHKDRIVKTCTEFLHEVITSIWPERMQLPLWSEVVSKQVREYEERADAELDNLDKDRLRRVPPYAPDFLAQVKELEQQLPRQQDQSLECYRLFVRMLAFYELTRKTFMANVLVQVVERHIICGLDSIFKPEKLIEMEETTVNKIAAEDELTQTRRHDLEQKVKDFDNIHTKVQTIMVKTKQREKEKEKTATPIEAEISEEPQPKRKLHRRDTTSAPTEQRPITKKETRKPVRRRPRTPPTTSEGESESETDRAGRVPPNSGFKRAAEGGGGRQTTGGRRDRLERKEQARQEEEQDHPERMEQGRPGEKQDRLIREKQDRWTRDRHGENTKPQPQHPVADADSALAAPEDGSRQFDARNAARKLLADFEKDAKGNGQAREAKESWIKTLVDASRSGRSRVDDASEDSDADLAYGNPSGRRK